MDKGAPREAVMHTPAPVTTMLRTGAIPTLAGLGGREALERTLSSIGGEPIVVLLTGHPDPDAIGCALAHQRICEALGVPCTIAHVLPVSHRENRALVKLLNIEMVQLTGPQDLAPYKYY